MFDAYREPPLYEVFEGWITCANVLYHVWKDFAASKYRFEGPEIECRNETYPMSVMLENPDT